MTLVPDPGKAPQNRKAILWGAVVVVCLLLVGGMLYFSFSSNPVIVKYRELAHFYSSRREVKALLNRMGDYAPLVFILLQALQVIMAPIPGEATGFLGGLVFGTTLGFIYSTLGLILGSILAFGLGRWLGFRDSSFGPRARKARASRELSRRWTMRTSRWATTRAAR